VIGGGKGLLYRQGPLYHPGSTRAGARSRGPPRAANTWCITAKSLHVECAVHPRADPARRHCRVIRCWAGAATASTPRAVPVVLEKEKYGGILCDIAATRSNSFSLSRREGGPGDSRAGPNYGHPEVPGARGLRRSRGCLPTMARPTISGWIGSRPTVSAHGAMTDLHPWNGRTISCAIHRRGAAAGERPSLPRQRRG